MSEDRIPWRVGQHYRIHVYEDDRPVATFHTVIDAEQAVRDHNENDELRAALARVEALCDRWAQSPATTTYLSIQDYLRRAIAAAGDST